MVTRQKLIVYFFSALCLLVLLRQFQESNKREEVIVSSSNVQLDSILVSYAGLYASEYRFFPPFVRSPQKRRILSRTVLVTSCNFGYINHLKNFYCFAKQLGLKFIVISMDARTHEFVNSNLSTLSGGRVTSFLWNKGNQTPEQSYKFRSKEFNLISNRKVEAALEVLKHGYNVLFADVDVALVRDPVHHLIWDNVDYAHSVNLRCPHRNFNFSSEEVNTGFFFARSNSKNIRLWEASLANSLNFPELDDQMIFWQTMLKLMHPFVRSLVRCEDVASSSPQILVACALDECAFSAGMVQEVGNNTVSSLTILEKELRARKKNAVALHANYIISNEEKKEALQANGLWLVNEQDPSTDGVLNCKSFVPTF